MRKRIREFVKAVWGWRGGVNREALHVWAAVLLVAAVTVSLGFQDGFRSIARLHVQEMVAESTATTTGTLLAAHAVTMLDGSSTVGAGPAVVTLGTHPSSPTASGLVRSVSCVDATTSFQLSVTNHETSDPEILLLPE